MTPLPNDSEQRILCRYTTPELSEFVLIAEQTELPEFGEHLRVPIQMSRYTTHVVVFYVTDVHCSDESESMVFAEIEMQPVGRE